MNISNLKKFLIIFLIFIQSLFISAGARGLDAQYNFVPNNNIQTIKHCGRTNSNGFIFVDFKTNETALLSIDNMSEIMTSCENNSSNPCLGGGSSVNDNSPLISYVWNNLNKIYNNRNKTFSLLSSEITTRAP